MSENSEKVLLAQSVWIQKISPNKIMSWEKIVCPINCRWASSLPCILQEASIQSLRWWLCSWQVRNLPLCTCSIKTDSFFPGKKGQSYHKLQWNPDIPDIMNPVIFNYIPVITKQKVIFSPAKIIVKVKYNLVFITMNPFIMNTIKKCKRKMFNVPWWTNNINNVIMWLNLMSKEINQVAITFFILKYGASNCFSCNSGIMYM